MRPTRSGCGRNAQAVFSLAGEPALVTGGGSGLGLAMAGCLAAAGARVVLVGRRGAALAEAARTINDECGSDDPGEKVAVALPWDVNQTESLPALVREAEERVGPLSILINSAGIHLKKEALETADGEWASVMQTHVSAAFALSREAARGMLQRGKGSVLFMGSMASLLGIPSIAAYTTAKAAVVGLTRELAAEWTSRGVRVNAIIPGWIETGMTSAALDRDPLRKAKVMSRIMMQRLGEPDDIGWAAVYLCSRAATYITGTTLIVDGGASVGF